MKYTEFLERMIELLTPEENWCQGEYSLDKDGESHWGNEPEACQWCLEGAAHKILVKPSIDMTLEHALNLNHIITLRNFTIDNYELGLISFNDDRSHQEVVDMLHKALEDAQSKQ